MKKVRELLQLVISQGQSSRQADKIVGISKSSAGEYVSGFKLSGLRIEEIANLSDSDLLSAIAGPNREQINERYSQLVSQFSYIEKELKRPGVTLQLLWQELFDGHPKSYSYSQFCFHYQQWAKKQKVSMHMNHKSGDKLFIDYAGKTLEIVDRETREVKEVQFFVAILGAS